MEKKPYTKPTVTDHGSVVEKTKGRIGFTYEPIGQMIDEDIKTGSGDFAGEPNGQN